MSFIFTLLSSTPYIEILFGWVGWLTWLTLLASILILLWRWRKFQPSWNRERGLFFALLFVLVPFTTLLIGIRLPPQESLSLLGASNLPQGPALMIFAALPWMLAAGFLGPIPAAILAALSGGLLAYTETHNIFTLLEYAFVATLFSFAVRQNYRTLVFQQLRRPIIAAIAVSFINPLIVAGTSMLALSEFNPVASDIVASKIGLVFAANLGQLLIAGFFITIAALGAPKKWGSQAKEVPAPAETSLKIRLQYKLAMIVFPLVMILAVGIWNESSKAAKQLIQAQMQNTAAMAAQSIPFFLDSGERLISKLAANEQLYSASPEEIKQILRDDLESTSFFQQLFVMDANGDPRTGYPSDDFQSLNPTAEEKLGILLNLQGVIFQTYSATPTGKETAAQVSFLHTLEDARGNSRGVLIGRTSLSSNPLSIPILKNLKQIESLQGFGVLVDPEGNIIYHPNSNLIMSTYTGIINRQPTFNSETNSDGVSHLSFNQLIQGNGWTVITSVPLKYIQQQTLQIALPLYGLFLGFGVLLFILMRSGLQDITKPLKELERQTKRIASGHLDHSLPIRSLNEIGQLETAFEAMRLSLKLRLDEIQRMLFVSQGVASSLDIETAVIPILEAALSPKISSARLILAQNVMSDHDQDAPSQFGVGDKAENYQDLDEQILQLNRQQDLIALTNPARAGLDFSEDMPQPGAILAIALRHEGIFYGSLWLVYKDGHKLKKEESRFLVMLADQAALAAANASLYLKEQIGRRRLDAVLASTPNPVLVTDHKDRLILANPAAINLFSINSQPHEGMPINKLIHQKELLDILLAHNSDQRATEIQFSQNRVFYATASPVTTLGQSMGRVCVLHDITYLKELDSLKSQFVDSVSHDLREPLKLLRSYANMLETAGDLNHQQSGYVDKIVAGAEDMTALVNNLLDLGRIETGTQLQTQKVQLLEIVRQVVHALQAKAVQKKIQLSLLEPQSALPLIVVDIGMLQQAIQNLVENAIMFTNRGGSIQVSISSNQDGVILSVEDNGIGVAPIDQPRIFERFYRIDQNDKSGHRNSGLGLAIVKSIAERHHGKVWLESNLGDGSAFHLSIPFRQPQEIFQR